MLFKLAKSVDTAFLPETKMAFFKESKNGELKVCYRGRCWLLLSCIFGRGDRYSLSKIFRASLDPDDTKFRINVFLINAKNFVRSPESEEYLDDVLALFNRCRCTSFNFFDKPELFSEALELSEFFVHEPVWGSPQPQNQRLALAYEEMAWEEEHAELSRRMIDWVGENNLNAKDLISCTKSICELASDWDIALSNMGLEIDLIKRHFRNPLPRQLLHTLPSTFLRKERSDHVSKNIDSIFNLKRNTSTIFDHEAIVQNFILLLGNESYTFEKIVRMSDHWGCLREEIPTELLSIFKESDAFAEKTKFLASFFIRGYSFLGYLVQNFDVLQRLRTGGDKLGDNLCGSDKFNVCYLAPRTTPDYENAIIEFLTNPICCKLSLLEKFKIFNVFNQYHSVFEKTDILNSVLNFFKDRIAKDYDLSIGIAYFLHIIVNCLKNLPGERNPLYNFNQKSFCAFLDHFYFPDGCSLLFSVFAAMVLPSDIDWGHLTKSMEMQNTPIVKFGSVKLLENGDESIQNFDRLMWSVVSGEPRKIVNTSELYNLLRIVVFTYKKVGEKFYFPQPEKRYDKALILSMKMINEKSCNKIPMVMSQVQNFLAPFELMKYQNEKAIAKLISQMTKIPKIYQELTSAVIDVSRRVFFEIVCGKYITKFSRQIASESSEGDRKAIFGKKIWVISKIQIFFESLNIGAVLQERHDMNDDIIFKILEYFMFLRAKETIDAEESHLPKEQLR